jgi:hypothetical protein
LPEQRRRRPLYHPKNPIEGRIVAVVGVGDVLQRRELGVELEQQPHLVLVRRVAGLVAQHPGLAAVERDHQIESGEVGRIELAGAVTAAVVAGAVEGGDRPLVRPLPHVPVARARRFDRDAILEPGARGEGAQHDLGHRRPADVAGADEGDTEALRRVRGGIRWRHASHSGRARAVRKRGSCGAPVRVRRTDRSCTAARAGLPSTAST